MKFSTVFQRFERTNTFWQEGVLLLALCMVVLHRSFFLRHFLTILSKGLKSANLSSKTLQIMSFPAISLWQVDIFLENTVLNVYITIYILVSIQHVIQISESKTLEELQTHCQPLTDYLATAGCLRGLTSLMDKDKLVEDILLFHESRRCSHRCI